MLVFTFVMAAATDAHYLRPLSPLVVAKWCYSNYFISYLLFRLHYIGTFSLILWLVTHEYCFYKKGRIKAWFFSSFYIFMRTNTSFFEGDQLFWGFFFWLCLIACGILVSWPETEPRLTDGESTKSLTLDSQKITYFFFYIMNPWICTCVMGFNPLWLLSCWSSGYRVSRRWAPCCIWLLPVLLMVQR